VIKRLVTATVCCAMAAALAPLAASEPGKPSFGCPPGFNLGSKTFTEYLALERTKASIDAGLVTEADIVAALATVDRNENGRVCVQLSTGFETAGVTALFYNVVDDNASTP
jgi:hypothetical protein